MINDLIPLLLFVLIFLAYVFSEPVISSKTPSIKLKKYNECIQNNNIPPPPPDIQLHTLEENMVNNMKPLSCNQPMRLSSYQPILSSNFIGASLTT